MDDEPLARERIRKLLQKEPEIEVLGEYAVILRNGTRLTLSRSHREKLNRLLAKTP